MKISLRLLFFCRFLFLIFVKNCFFLLKLVEKARNTVARFPKNGIEKQFLILKNRFADIQ